VLVLVMVLLVLVLVVVCAVGLCWSGVGGMPLQGAGSTGAQGVPINTKGYETLLNLVSPFPFYPHTDPLLHAKPSPVAVESLLEGYYS